MQTNFSALQVLPSGQGQVSWQGCAGRDCGLGVRAQPPLPAQFARCLSAAQTPRLRRRQFRVFLKVRQPLRSRSGCSGMPIVRPKDQSEQYILWTQMQLA